MGPCRNLHTVLDLGVFFLVSWEKSWWYRIRVFVSTEVISPWNVTRAFSPEGQWSLWKNAPWCTFFFLWPRELILIYSCIMFFSLSSEVMLPLNPKHNILGAFSLSSIKSSRRGRYPYRIAHGCNMVFSLWQERSRALTRGWSFLHSSLIPSRVATVSQLMYVLLRSWLWRHYKVKVMVL